MKRRNNNKKLKIIIGIIVFILALIATYIILIIKDILPNSQLDTKDLFCHRINYVAEVIDGAEYVFSFDEEAKFSKYKLIYYTIYPSYEEAKEYYDNNKEIKDNMEFIEEENRINTIYIVSANESNELKDKTKEEIKQLYIDRYFYECK